VQCVESLGVQAHFDGELDPLAAADIERHLDHCADCRALLDDLVRTRTVVWRRMRIESAPPELRGRIMRLLDREAAMTSARPSGSWIRSAWRSSPFWAGALGGVTGAAVAATLALVLMSPAFNNSLLDDLAAAHVRSLMPSHLFDVASTDQHTVKPWFAGHTDVSPVVADFARQGFRLVGGRADYLAHQRSAVVVYQHGPHVINVFGWAAGQHSLPRKTTHDGYHMAFWKEGDLEYCAVSDTGWDELMGLVRLLQAAESADVR
jgi:anti-sigma factor RsiW